MYHSPGALTLQANNKRLTKFLFAMEGVGIVFMLIFLAAYVGGLFYKPQTTVLHSEPAFKIPLMAFGAAFLILILLSAILVVAKKSKA